MEGMEMLCLCPNFNDKMFHMNLIQSRNSKLILIKTHMFDFIVRPNKIWQRIIGIMDVLQIGRFFLILNKTQLAL